jgi:hypothetical protein
MLAAANSPETYAIRERGIRRKSRSLSLSFSISQRPRCGSDSCRASSQQASIGRNEPPVKNLDAQKLN